MKEMKEMKEKVSAQEKRIVELESRLAALETGQNTDEEEVKEEAQEQLKPGGIPLHIDNLKKAACMQKLFTHVAIYYKISIITLQRCKCKA